MTTKIISLCFFLIVTTGNIHGQQTKNTMEKNNENPLLCNPETGLCEIPTATPASNNGSHTDPQTKPVKVVYFTDPICSSCWGIEPQLRKLKLEYGNMLDIEYRMGGLLPDWSYNSGGISKPADVARHWDEVSVHYDMPIDGDVWLEDPLHSSYPPSIAFKAAQMQDREKAILFLRTLREMVFLQKKNITRWEYIAVAASATGLDTAQLRTDVEGRAKDLFNDDLQLARQYGVRGFPTMFFTDSLGNQEMVYGSKPYAAYESAIIKLQPETIKGMYKKEGRFLFDKYPSLTAREFTELSGLPRSEAEQQLQHLTDEGIVEQQSTKNGAIWRLR